MTDPASYDDPEFRAAERAVGRRRAFATAIAVVALAGIAGGSAVGAVESAQGDRAEHAAVWQQGDDAS